MIHFVFGTLGILLLVFAVLYNRLQRHKHQALEAYSGIEVALSKRFDLITNLVEVTKGYAAHERLLFSELTQIRSLLQAQPQQADNLMNQTKNQLMAVVENYPELKADQHFLTLQHSLIDVEEHLQASRRLYNRLVSELNIACHQLPTSWVADFARIEPMTLFEAEAQAHQPVSTDMS